MKSIIDQIYRDNFSGKQPPVFDDSEQQRQWEQSTMFYTGFCLGARLMLETLSCPDFD